MRGISRRFANLSLALKLTVLITATSAVAMAALCAVLGWSDSATLRSQLVNDTAVLADTIGAGSKAALAFHDGQGAAQMLHTLEVNQHVVMAAILLPDGQVLARYDRTGRAAVKGAMPASATHDALQRTRWYQFFASRLAMSSRVMLDSETLGVAYVEVDLSELQSRLLKLWASLGLALLATVALAGAIAWRLQRVVSAPLLRLAEITREVTVAGNYSIRASKTSNDEIGQVVSGFNDMLDDIQRRDVMLQSHRQELEHTVGQRTAELQSSMERYKLLIECTNTVPWEIDGASHVFSYISPQASKLFGYDYEALTTSMSMRDLVPAEDQSDVLRRFTDLAGAGRGDLDVDHSILTAERQVVHVRSVVAAHRRPDGTVVLRGITIDVTQQKKLEVELRQAQKLESVGRLAAGVAHEINTPVQFVSDSVHFVRDAMNEITALLHVYADYCTAVSAGTDEPNAAAVSRAVQDADLEYLVVNVPKALERSLEGLERVATIVRSMKEFAHPDQREMAPANLNQAIHSTLTIARNEYKYVADLETDLGELPLVTCHIGDINQAILNIVINAAHAIEGVVSGTSSRGCIVLWTRVVGTDVVIRISDTGGGIPAAIRERIFDLFFTTKAVGKGTGQGLAIARSVIMEKHQGELTCEVDEGHGTTFVIRLPIDGGVRKERAA
jgi:PAS domain S-box-containing protein